jgi:hypothetical protein
MVKESAKTVILLTTLSMVTAAVALLSTVKPLVIGVALPMILVSLALMIDSGPRVNVELAVMPSRIYVNDEVEVKVKVKVMGGYGIMTLRLPPRPGSLSRRALS